MAQISLFPMESILLPGSILPLQVFEERYVHLIQDCIGRTSIGLIQPSTEDAIINPPLSAMGCSGRIIRFEELENGRFFVILRGEKRFHYIEDSISPRGYREAEVRWVIEPPSPDEAEKIIADRPEFMENLSVYLDNIGMKADISEIEETSDARLIDTLAMLLPTSATDRQALLEAYTLSERLQILEAIINGEDSPKIIPKWQH